MRFWTFDFLSKLVYDGNGNYSISKKEIDTIKESILNNNVDERVINSQSSRILMSLMSENIIT